MVSRPDVVGFSKTSIFSVIIIVFIFLRKGNIASIGVLITSAGNYLNTHAIYTKGKFDLFCMFTSALKGYNGKERKL
jgi:hypothetical protein